MQDNSVKDTVKVLREWPMRDYITRCNSFGLIKCAADIIEQQKADLETSQRKEQAAVAAVRDLVSTYCSCREGVDKEAQALIDMNMRGPQEVQDADRPA